LELIADAMGRPIEVGTAEADARYEDDDEDDEDDLEDSEG
jgi:hypothetical protein